MSTQENSTSNAAANVAAPQPTTQQAPQQPGSSSEALGAVSAQDR